VIIIRGLHCIKKYKVVALNIAVKYSDYTSFFIVRSTRPTNFANLFLAWKSTCFGQCLCPSSGVYSLYTQQWYMSFFSLPVWHWRILRCVLQVHHPRWVFIQNRVVGSVETQLSYDRYLLVWQWLYISAVLGHLQVISCFTFNNNKEKTYTWDKALVVFNEISLLVGFYTLELYKYKIRLNLETGMEKKNWHEKRKLVISAEFRAGSFCVGTLG
jgi:hypothetical protein